MGLCARPLLPSFLRQLLCLCSLPGIRSFSNRILSTGCHSCANILSLASAHRIMATFTPPALPTPNSLSSRPLLCRTLSLSLSELELSTVQPHRSLGSCSFVRLWNYFESGNWFSFLTVHDFPCCSGDFILSFILSLAPRSLVLHRFYIQINKIHNFFLLYFISLQKNQRLWSW